jgi:hypothetical protein
MRPVTREVLRALVAEIRSEISAEVGQLRADLTIEKAAERRERDDGVVDLPALPMRSPRRA